MALAATVPFVLYLSSRGLDLRVLVPALFSRGMGQCTVGLPSPSAAYAALDRQDLPMATTSLNIVQRLGGPTLTTLCATDLGRRLGSQVADHTIFGAYAWAFWLPCGLHALIFCAACRGGSARRAHPPPESEPRQVSPFIETAQPAAQRAPR